MSEFPVAPKAANREAIRNPADRISDACWLSMAYRHRRGRLRRPQWARRARRFIGPGQRGSTTIETAVGIFILVASLGGLMESVGAAFDSDRMARAARAAARSLALDPAADACAAIRRELGLPDDFDCGSKWTLDIDEDLTPSDFTADTTDLTSLNPGAPLAGSGDGHMVMVRIGTRADPPELAELLAMALARREP